jgi:hypothetical protein
MKAQHPATIKFCGEAVDAQHLGEIKDVVSIFPKLTRTELANTICELLEWKRPTGKLKTVECLRFLEGLDDKGIIQLPASRTQYVKKSILKIAKTEKTLRQPSISVKLSELTPILLKRVEGEAQRKLWYEYVDRYHYLGYRIPFGAQLRYFIESGQSHVKLGCLQFSSPAWRMAPRDEWIGWNDEQRKKNLQKIINNSRFLIFPWVQVKNLASTALSLVAKTVPADWLECYGYRPVLLETLVDQKRFEGTCYKAANWVYVGRRPVEVGWIFSSRTTGA